MKTFNIVTLVIVLSMLVMSAAESKSGSFGGRSSSSSSRSSFGGSSSSRSSFGGSSSSRSSFGGSSSSRSSSPSSTGWFSFGGTTTNKAITRTAIGGAALGTASASAQTPTNTNSVNINRDNTVSSIKAKGATGESASGVFNMFKQKNTPSATVNIPNTSRPAYSSYNRSTYYSGYTPSYSPRYRETVYVNHSNGYGIWDLMMFNAIMDNHGDRQMYYHHQNDQAFRDWRTDADKACAAGDVDVCTKLKDLDREMAEYKAKGIQQNSTYTTPGVDPNVYKATPAKPVATEKDESDDSSIISVLLWLIGGSLLLTWGVFWLRSKRGF